KAVYFIEGNTQVRKYQSGVVSTVAAIPSLSGITYVPPCGRFPHGQIIVATGHKLVKIDDIGNVSDFAGSDSAGDTNAGLDTSTFRQPQKP
ncbi:hypothetical protein ABTF76_20645, partial [Acinetobacter baumannii]